MNKEEVVGSGKVLWQQVTQCETWQDGAISGTICLEKKGDK